MPEESAVAFTLPQTSLKPLLRRLRLVQLLNQNGQISYRSNDVVCALARQLLHGGNARGQPNSNSPQLPGALHVRAAVADNHALLWRYA
jgi:hypothetical protein